MMGSAARKTGGRPQLIFIQQDNAPAKPVIITLASQLGLILKGKP
jgi:hypothetical protein